MHFFKDVPAIDPIGIDLKQMLGFSESLFVAQKAPYVLNAYPPLASVLFAPLLLVPISGAYRIVVFFITFCYLIMTLMIPLRISRERVFSPLLMLVLVTGLFSYGFQFELERGQWNVIAVSMCFLAIWIFHYHPRYRFLAYALFTISVQLKIYPLVFIFMFVDNWRDWRSNIKRLLILGAVNFALLLVLGPFVFVNWLKGLATFAGSPYIWVGNHSILSFVTLVFHTASESGWAWMNQYSGWAQVAFLALVLACIAWIVLQAYQQERRGLNVYLLLACTIASLLIPSVSHDYKLSLLAAPVAFLFSAGGFSEIPSSHRLRASLIGLTLAFSIAYFSTLYSYENKTHLLQNNLPALVAMLLITTLFSMLDSVYKKDRSDQEHPAVPER